MFFFFLLFFVVFFFFSYVFADIPFLDSHSSYFFKKNGLKLLQDKALEIIPKDGRTEARSWLGLRKES